MSGEIMVYQSSFGLCLCTSCKVAIDMDHIARHLRQTHNWSSENALRHRNHILDIRQSSDCVNTDMRDTYLSAKGEEMGDHILPALSFLPVETAWRCNLCGKIYPSKVTTDRHTKSCTKRDKHTLPTSIQVEAQTIFGGNKSRYFPVKQQEKGASSSIRDWWLTISFKQSLGHESTGMVGKRLSEMNGFLAHLRFDQYLRQFDITNTKAVAYCKPPTGATWINICKQLYGYLHNAFKLTCTNVYIKTHIFLDSRIHLAVDPKTVDRYRTQLKSLCSFLFHVAGCGDDSLQVESVLCSDLGKHITAWWHDSESSSNHKSMHEVLMKVFFSSGSDAFDAIPLFLACASLKSTSNSKNSFRFAQASEMSPLLAALKYLIQCIIVNDVYNLKADPCEGWDLFDRISTKKSDCAAVYVNYVMGVIHGIRKSELSAIRFSICDIHNMCGIIDGEELSLPSLGAKIRELQKEAWTVLTTKLLFGLNLDMSFWHMWSTLQDNMGDKTPGFWFGTHPKCKTLLYKWQEQMLNNVRSSSSLVDGQTINRKNGMDYLEQCTKYQLMLYTLIQLTCGGPARATEMSAMNLKNDVAGQRNVFIFQGRVLFASSYHKGREKLGGLGKPIARFPDSVTAGLVVVYACFVHPFSNVILKALEIGPRSPDCGSLDTQHTRLFSENGTELGPEALRAGFSSVMKHIGINLGTNQFRHYHVGVVKHLISPSPLSTTFLQHQDDDDNCIGYSAALHHQAGHSSNTAHEIYGVSPTEMKMLSLLELDQFRKASSLWHRLLGLSHGCPAHWSLPIGDYCNERKMSTDGAAPAAQQNNKNSCNKKSFINDDDVMNQLTNMSRKLEHITTAMDYLAEQARNKKPRMESTAENIATSDQTDPTHTMGGYNLEQVMCNMLNISNGTFKTVQQKQAVEISMEGKRDALIILPTGGGKSMTFMIPAFVCPTKTYVVILPIVALQNDILRRCCKQGIHAVTWKDRDSAGATVVLASAEHVQQESYLVYVKEKYATNKLHAIYVDEAHLFVQWASFRSSLKDFMSFIRPATVSVPVIALTATCPKSLEHDICTAVGISGTPALVRCSTSRLNIRYQVRHVDAANDILFETIKVVRDLKKSATQCIRAIVYCLTRKMCEDVATMLNCLIGGRLNAYQYHAGMDSDTRDLSFNQWRCHVNERTVNVMVATSAFGCGVDVGDVDMVIHAGAPRSVVSFVQESGRCGRNGQLSTSIVIGAVNNKEDDGHQQQLVDGTLPCHQINNNNKNEGSISIAELASSSSSSAKKFGTLDDWMIASTSDCRRWLLDSLIDNVTERRRCEERDAAKCDVCEKQTHRRVCDISQKAGNHDHDCDDDDCLSTQAARVANLPSANSVEQATDNDVHVQKCNETVKRDELNKQHRQISTEYLKKMSDKCSKLCAVCSMGKLKEIQHSEGVQVERCYSGRCLRCGSRKHFMSNCQFIAFQGNAYGGCYSCSLRLHTNERIHSRGEWSNRNCNHRNAMRMLVLAWEHPQVNHRLRKRFCNLPLSMNVEQFVDWLRTSNCRGELWYSHALSYILESEFQDH